MHDKVMTNDNNIEYEYYLMNIKHDLRVDN
jgi:hypothetical protein